MNTLTTVMTFNANSSAASVSRIAIRVHLAVTWLVLLCNPATLRSAARRRHLRVLRSYWQQGKFPTNTLSKNITPVFRDEYGVMCAMGYLAYKDGREDLITEIVATNNTINLTRETSLAFDSWLSTTGLTHKEAARVQPSYGYCDYDYSCSPSVSNSLPDWIPLAVVILLTLPLYISIVGTYLIVGKRLITEDGRLKRVFKVSLTLLTVCLGLAIILGIVWWASWTSKLYS